MEAVGTAITAMLFVACSGQSTDSGEAEVRDPPIDAESVQLPFEEGEVLTEQVRDCDGIVSVDAHQFLCRNSEGVWFIDESVSDQTFIGEHETMSAVRVDDGIMMVLDGDPFEFDGVSLEPIGLPVPVPVESMQRSGGAVWMTGVGRLFRMVEGTVSEIGIDGHGELRSFAATPTRLHVALPELLSIDVTASSPESLTLWDEPVESMASDEAGDLWLVSGGRLFVKRGDSEPVEVAMPEPVSQVVGPTIWVQGESSLYQYREGGFSVFPLVASGMVGADAYGRLLQVREGALRRHSSGRPVVVVGLSDSLMVSETVTLLPSDPDSLDQLRVWIGDLELEVSSDPYRVTVDPEDLTEGSHFLRFFTESEKGDSLAEHSVWVGELPLVQWPEIEALSNEHCVRCHGGETLTDLSTSTGWERHIDDIIAVVSSQDMPLGGPYLSDQEITVIRAWKHGGFQ